MRQPGGTSRPTKRTSRLLLAPPRQAPDDSHTARIQSPAVRFHSIIVSDGASCAHLALSTLDIRHYMQAHAYLSTLQQTLIPPASLLPNGPGPRQSLAGPTPCQVATMQSGSQAQRGYSQRRTEDNASQPPNGQNRAMSPNGVPSRASTASMKSSQSSSTRRSTREVRHPSHS